MTKNYKSLLKLICPKEKEGGLKVGSKFMIPFNGEEKEFVVIGIGQNPNPENNERFMDIMSTELLLKNIKWEIINDTSLTLDNNEYKNLFYTRSNIFGILKSQKKYFPQEIQDVIIPRITEFLTSWDFVTGERTYSLVDIGDVWVPSLGEVFGEIIFSNDSPHNEQYEYFKDVENRKLGDLWWLRSSYCFNDCDADYVHDYGGWNNDRASLGGVSAPLCLRLKLND